MLKFEGKSPNDILIEVDMILEKFAKNNTKNLEAIDKAFGKNDERLRGIEKEVMGLEERRHKDQERVNETIREVNTYLLAKISENHKATRFLKSALYSTIAIYGFLLIMLAAFLGN